MGGSNRSCSANSWRRVMSRGYAKRYLCIEEGCATLKISVMREMAVKADWMRHLGTRGSGAGVERTACGKANVPERIESTTNEWVEMPSNRLRRHTRPVPRPYGTVQD